jgi:cyclopropane fatty-acyl-phospholipid synthase-like methyltransferase
MLLIPLITLIFTSCFLVYFIYAYVLNRGAVFYPSTHKAIEKVLKLAKINKKDILIDFGSGDGVVVIETAKRGIKAIGYEMDPLLVKSSRKKIKKLGLEKLAEIRMANMYKADFNEGTILYFYQFPEYLEKFEKLLDKNLTKKIKVISNRYKFPNKKIHKSLDKIYLYWWGR